MLSASNIKLCLANNPATSFSTTSVGGVISSGPTYVNGTAINEVFFSIDPEALGGSTKVQTQKLFWRNESGTDAAKSCSMYLENYLDDAPSNAVLSVVSDSALDDGTLFVRILAFDNSGNPIQVDITLNGTTAATSISSALHISRAEVRSTTGQAITASNGNITVKSGSTVLGIIPFGLRGATHELSILMEATLDSSTTIANTSANPTGTFFSPRDAASALLFSANLVPAGGPHAQGFWARETVPPATLGSEFIDHSFLFNCKV